MEASEHIERLEDNIVKHITKIRNSHSRPCFKNILSSINRDGFNLNMEELKDFTNKMIEKNIIYDNGKEGVESFYLTEVGNMGKTLAKENINDLESDLINYLNDEFYDILIKRIKSEVSSALTELNARTISTDINNSLTFQQESNNTKTDNNNNILIAALNDEIKFLRSEINSKDTIIELLIKEKPLRDDKNNQTSCTNAKYTESFIQHDNHSDNNSFVYPKKSFRVNHNTTDSTYNIKTHNRYQLLNTTPLTECDDFDYNESNSDFHDVSTQGASNQVKRKSYRSTTIIGDSIIKDIKYKKIKKDITKGDKIYIQSFKGATTECMVDYIKPSLKYYPDLIILHTGANDLRSRKPANVIADDIINLARDIKTFSNDVVVSSIIQRNDDLNFKGQQVNEHLITKCMERNLLYIDSSNINVHQHVSTDGLHLNYQGTVELANNFLDCVNL